MGVNAVTSVPTYVDGQVLEASRLNVTNSGIPVFATTTTRDAAFGGTGEKVLGEGQFAYIEASNTTQYYDGAAWQNVGASGLVYITGATFTTVSSVSLPDNTFSSTYRNYLVHIAITANSTDSTAFNIRMRASGTDTTTAYYGVCSGNSVNSGTYDGTYRQNNASAFNPGILRTTDIADQSYSLTFFNPQIAANTMYSGTAVATLGDYGGAFLTGTQVSTTQFDSLSFYPTAGTITGTYRVYGYSES